MDAFRFSISWARLIPSNLFLVDDYIILSENSYKFWSINELIYVVNFQLSTAGKLKDGVNKIGVQFYKDLLDELLANGKITNLLAS